MTQAVSTKTYVLVMRDGSKFYLDEREADLVKLSLKKGDRYLEIGESLINAFEFVKIVNSMDYEEAERFKHGDYKCPTCKEWIPKGRSCGKCLA